MRNSSLSLLVTSALLCAVGVLLPLLSPFKVVLEPASFTLGSHIAIMIGMLISPPVAVAVSLGTALGFFFGGFPLVVVLRAFSHVVFAFVGAVVLRKMPSLLDSLGSSSVFSFVLGLVHALCEVAIVTVFYFGSNLSQLYYAKGFAMSVLVLVGVGTVIHSMVDFALALLIWRVVSKRATGFLATK